MGLKIFTQNIIRLFKFDLKEHHKIINQVKKYPFMFDNFKYQLYEDIPLVKLPHILNQYDSLLSILNSDKSVSRFGDGEFNLIFGNSIGFQEYTPELAKRLKDILMSDDDGILIGISRRFGSLEDVSEDVRNYWRWFMGKYRNKLYEMLDFNKTYIDTCMTAHSIEVEDHTLCQDDSEKYYALCRKIWDNKDITIIKGEGTEKVTFDIYDNAKSINYIYAPKKNAFRKYNEILEEAKKQPKDRLIILILGPTATVLAYDLHKLGYRALDIGHLAKAYDWLKTHNTKIVAGQFFAS